MADLAKTIEIIFAGTDNVSDVIDKVGTSMQSVGGKLTDIGKPFADATVKVLALDAAILGLGVAALKASADIDDQTAKMAGSLGITTAEAEKFGDIAKDVYSNAWGDSLAQSFDAVSEAQKRFGDNAAVDIGKVTEQAFKLQSVFGTDYKESLQAVSSLTKNFGISTDEAFNFITAGFQKGLNGSGDFLESITEYGVQFQAGGANAGQFFSVLESGFIDGVAGTDKAADAFKEFRVRIQDGSQGTADALKSIGIDNAALQKNLDAGKITVADAFQKINEAIQKTDDKGVAFRAGVGLMGTQFEDMGQKAALSIDLTKTKIEDLKGSLDKIDTTTISTNFESLYRTITTSIADNDTWDVAKAKLSGIFVEMTGSFKEAFGKLDLTDLENKIGDIWNGIADVFKSSDLDLTTVEGMENAIGMVVDTIETLADVTKGVIDILNPLVTIAIELLREFNSLDDGTKDLIGNILGLGTALTVLGTAVSTGGSLLSGFSNITSLLSSGGSLAVSIAGTVKSFIGGGGLTDALVAVISSPSGLLALAGAVGVAAGSMARFIPGVDEAAQGFAEWTDELLNWTGTKGIAAASEGTADLQLQAYRLSQELKSGKTDVKNYTDEITDFDSALRAVQEVPTEYNLDIKGKADVESLNIAQKQIEEKIPTEGIVLIQSEVDANSLANTTQKIEEAIPPIKRLEIEANIQTEAIKAQAATVQTALEWKAKIDIADIEAGAKKVEAIMSSVSTSATTAGTVLSAIFGNLDPKNSLSFEMEAIIDRQITLQEKALEIQSKVAEAEIDLMEAKRKQISNGPALIQVEAAGLTPALEMIWQEIISYSQVRATEEGLSLLL